MILALGFFLAGLLVLLLLPAFWSRAVRLSLRRLESRLPISMEEIAADRDRLRAENAVASRRIEQTVERMGRAHALDRAELGRNLARIRVLETDMAAQAHSIRDLDDALRESERNRVHAEAERGGIDKMLYDASGLMDRKEMALQTLSDRLGELTHHADERRTAFAALEMTAQAVQARNEAVEERLRQTAAALHKRNNEIQIAVNARDAAIEESAFLQSRLSMLQTRLDTQKAQIAELDALRSAAAQERGAGLAEVARHQATVVRREQQIEDAQAQIAELGEKLSRANEARRALERDLLLRLEKLRAQRDAALGALDAAQRERNALGRSSRDGARPRPGGMDMNLDMSLEMNGAAGPDRLAPASDMPQIPALNAVAGGADVLEDKAGHGEVVRSSSDRVGDARDRVGDARRPQDVPAGILLSPQ